ncbi:MAG TPA: hypothetical protein DCM27_02405 [Rhodospirillaceae bacterium]|nr:hypothetical protein [Rhodospirillaceae bacterium]
MVFTFEQAIGLVIATAILGLSPGPAVFATVARSLSHPFRITLFFIMGIVLGDLIFAMIAMGGFAFLVAQHEIYFLILKWLGGAYLIYLGGKTLLSPSSVKHIQTVETEGKWKLVVSGFLLTAGNPKDLLFFVSFLPAFIDLKTAGLTDMLLAAILIVITFIATLCFYAGLVTIAGNWLNNPKAVLWLDRMAGIILVIVGLMVLLFS